MFAVRCPRHGHRVLLDIGRLERMVNLGDGLILVHARCYDGEPIIEITGIGSRLPPHVVGQVVSAEPRRNTAPHSRAIRTSPA